MVGIKTSILNRYGPSPPPSIIGCSNTHQIAITVGLTVEASTAASLCSSGVSLSSACWCWCNTDQVAITICCTVEACAAASFYSASVPLCSACSTGQSTAIILAVKACTAPSLCSTGLSIPSTSWSSNTDPVAITVCIFTVEACTAATLCRGFVMHSSAGLCLCCTCNCSCCCGCSGSCGCGGGCCGDNHLPGEEDLLGLHRGQVPGGLHLGGVQLLEVSISEVCLTVDHSEDVQRWKSISNAF